MRIPFISLSRQYATIKEDIDRVFDKIFNDFQFIKGDEVKAFELEFAKSIGAMHCVTTGNGTDALFLIMKAKGIGKGDEVITPAWSWISSAETISLCGALPVFVDADPVYYTLDIADVEKKITTKTKAIIAVHLYGQAAALHQLKEICLRNNLLLIEDCAQAHFTSIDGSFVGSGSDASAFSFYPTKNLGAYGDAGCVLTNDEGLAEKIRRLANHGALQKDDHFMEGTNSRMDTLQAGILLAKLTHLRSWTQKRTTHAALYRALLKDIPNIILPAVTPGSLHSYHIYALRAERRDELKQFLAQHGIETMIHYPVAVVNLPAYQYVKLRSEYPVANQLEKEVLSLPIYPELSDEQISYISEKIIQFYR
jgi:dTDP-4-amino-4,6-dideoxygalactose transaminase